MPRSDRLRLAAFLLALAPVLAGGCASPTHPPDTVHSIALVHTRAAEMASIVRDLTEVPSRVRTGCRGPAREIPSVTVVADARVNSLIVQGPADRCAAGRKLVLLLDRPPADGL